MGSEEAWHQNPISEGAPMNFNPVKIAVAAQWEKMQKHPLFRVEVEGLWETYLNAFPPGSNPVLKTRTEHDCSCCKQFIRSVGNVVAIINDQIVSVWDVTVPEYQAPMDAMAHRVKASNITDVFLIDTKTVGTDKNFQQLTEGIQTWTHFFVNIHPGFVAKEIPTKLSELRSTRDVFVRSLTEITDEAVDTVLDLMAQNSLYRGEEHKSLVASFKTAKKEFNQLSTIGKVLYSWKGFGALARIRSTVIGTLLVDLSEGKEIDQAVAGYEAKVAPMNYKRPTALITKAMIDKAKAALSELGLTSALERRYATLQDITINNVIFADRTTRLASSPLDDLAPTAPVKVSDKIEEITIDKFIKEVVPRAETIEVLFEHPSNLVSLIAPTDATALPLFKWPNKFSWSYNGDVADSIRERVKKAGGNVSGDLCCRLSWFNYDDLDLHLYTPGRGHIWFRDKRGLDGGQLDVDMNAGSGNSREAVENIFYADRRTMKEGEYLLVVNQFMRRESVDIGFEVEIDYLGEVRRYAYDQVVVGDVTVAKFKYSHKGGIQIIESLPSSRTVKTIWNLPTQSFHKVNAVMLSPNHWDGQAIGNKHYFFMLAGCKNDGSARGFFNEFLTPELDKHRKVLEVVGSRLKAEGDNQLSGLGFSSTQRNTLTCRVKGSFSRTIKVVF
jgi:hypothetical protein